MMRHHRGMQARLTHSLAAQAMERSVALFVCGQPTHRYQCGEQFSRVGGGQTGRVVKLVHFEAPGVLHVIGSVLVPGPDRLDNLDNS
jgi:hypothetical protein